MTADTAALLITVLILAAIALWVPCLEWCVGCFSPPQKGERPARRDQRDSYNLGSGRRKGARGGKTMAHANGLQRTTILVAGDHPLMRRGLVEALNEEPSLRVVAEVADGVAALQAIQAQAPQVAILDIDMPRLNGLQIVQKIQELQLTVAVLLLTLDTNLDLLLAALDLGARGYILKNSAIKDVVKGVVRVSLGGTFMSAGVQQILIAVRLVRPGTRSLLRCSANSSPRSCGVLPPAGPLVSSLQTCSLVQEQSKTTEQPFAANSESLAQMHC